MPLFDEYSIAAKPLEMRFRTQLLARGTGFIWKSGVQAFLITNWHNVTGINPLTGKHISDHAAEPDSISILLDLKGGRSKDSDWFTIPIRCEDDGPLGRREWFSFPLRDSDGKPLWLEHLLGPSVDVIALRLPNLPSVELRPINEMRAAPMRIAVGMDAVVLGFPFGIGVSSMPIWKRASIASEPNLRGGTLYYYVDTASRTGMSGSPVILRTWGGFEHQDGSRIMHPGASTRFVGVYSGRIGAEDELKAQLGKVWHWDVVPQIISAPQPGRLICH